jgi:hypothetical protein
MVVGALGPWATALNFISVSGTRGDGWIVIAAALVGVACLWGCVARPSLLAGCVAAVCGVAATAVSAIDLHQLSSGASVNFFGTRMNLVQPGWGIYADLAASVAFVATVVALLVWWRPTRRAKITTKTGGGAASTAPAVIREDLISQRLSAPVTERLSAPAARARQGHTGSDRSLLIGLTIAAGVILVVFGAALYLGGVFNSTSAPAPVRVSVSHPVSAPPAKPVSGVTTTAPPHATPPVSPPAPPVAKQAQGPASVIENHLQDLNSGDYHAAYRLMSSRYRAKNPSWPSDRSAAHPGVEIVSVGAPRYGAGGAEVPVDFYARDRNPTQGSDTQCREFQGTLSLVKEAGDWRYDPAGGSVTATVVSPTNPRCPV